MRRPARARDSAAGVFQSAQACRNGLFGPGTPLPPLWHWLYFLPMHRQSEIGPDGHAKRGGFLPPVPLPRRMWAGSQLQFHRPVRVGDAMQRTSTIADVTVKDVYVFSREIAREAKGNAVAVTARHKGRHYALRGRVDYVQEDGQDYNVSFDIPEQGSGLLQVPGDNEPRVGVACLFKPNQLTTVLAMREGQKVTLTGTVYKYDNVRRVIWLENCTRAK